MRDGEEGEGCLRSQFSEWNRFWAEWRLEAGNKEATHTARRLDLAILTKHFRLDLTSTTFLDVKLIVTLFPPNHSPTEHITFPHIATKNSRDTRGNEITNTEIY